MTHVMLPDGLLPWWISVGGAVVAVLILGASTVGFRAEANSKAVASAAVMTALMVVAMSIDLVPIGYELHGTVLAGVVVGPRMASVAALVFNVVRALLGDGAFTNLGVNTVLTWLEMVGGFVGFRMMSRLVRARRVALAGGLATVLSLLVATCVYVVIMLVSGEASYGAVLTELGADADDTGRRSNLGAGVFVSFTFVAGAIGWAIEGLVTGVLLAFVARARPGLVRGMQGITASNAHHPRTSLAVESEVLTQPSDTREERDEPQSSFRP
jgi:ABC-type Co2+ transport system permease subunit